MEGVSSGGLLDIFFICCALIIQWLVGCLRIIQAFTSALSLALLLTVLLSHKSLTHLSGVLWGQRVTVDNTFMLSHHAYENPEWQGSLKGTSVN